MNADASWITSLRGAMRRSRRRLDARFAQLATVDAGGGPRCRTMVIRRFEPTTGCVAFITHGRSTKMTELVDGARGELCWYFRTLWTQFRLAGTLVVLGPDDPPARGLNAPAIWAELSAPTRVQMSWPPPGSPRKAGDSFPMRPPRGGIAPDFRVGVLEIDAVDHLELKLTGHRRTSYRRVEDGRWEVTPLRP